MAEKREKIKLLSAFEARETAKATLATNTSLAGEYENNAAILREIRMEIEGRDD